MSEIPIVVRIIAAPITCGGAPKDRWREVADLVARQLATSFGNSVIVEYYNFFDAGCPPLSADAALPVVLVNGSVLSNGGKVSVPLIRRHIESLRLPV